MTEVGGSPGGLTDQQRARIEANRKRALELREENERLKKAKAELLRRGATITIDGELVVPILMGKRSEVAKPTSIYAAQVAIPKQLMIKKHQFDLAFAVTDFKLQGKTTEDLLLSIAPRPVPPHLDLKGFYVMVSRARARRRLFSTSTGAPFLLACRSTPP